MVHAVKGLGGDDSFRAWPHVVAFVLLTGGFTMAFLAASTIGSNPSIALPALVAPGAVGLILAMQRRLDLRALVGLRFRIDVALLALATGPFLMVLAMVISGAPRTPIGALGWSFWIRLVAAAVAEVGWWGYLYPTLRSALPPLPAGLAVGLVWAGWHGLLAWAGANPLVGASPLLVTTWAVVAALVAGAILELRPPSVIPVAAFQLGLAAAVTALPFTPESSGTATPMWLGAGLLLALGAIGLLTARTVAVRRARHAVDAVPLA